MSAPALDDQTRKAFETLRAKAALLGATLILFEDDLGKPSLTLNRWCLTRTFSLAQLDDLEDLIGRMAEAS
jgi:hypothetical protein